MDEENSLLHFLETPSKHYSKSCDGFESHGDDHSDSSDTDPSSARERLEYLLNQPANKFCADCGTQDPKWAALPFGAFICIKCSGTHRSLGVHISKVISVNLDEWTDDEVNCLANSGGNATVNTRYEAFLPENYKKPRDDFTTEERATFIRKKYELQLFMNDPQFACPLRKPGSNKHHNQQHSSSRHGTFRNSWRKKEPDHKGVKKMVQYTPMASAALYTTSTLTVSMVFQMEIGMVEFVGLIKVDIVRGINLAVRDVMSSDPYVMIMLGHQSMKTKVIKNTLNPIWNERLMLSIPHPVPPLKVHVFDKDTFSADDRMGEAEVDIQPLISAARDYQSSVVTESTQICTFLASENSILAKDSVIAIVDGKVEQEIVLRLQNVEQGELEIKLECVPLSQ